MHSTGVKQERKVDNMTILERIDGLLNEKKMSRRKLERDAGLGTGTVAKWKDRNPTSENLQKVADVLHVSVSYLTGASEYRSEQDALIQKWNQQMKKDLPDEVRKIEAGIRIPVLGTVPCGIPMEAIEYVDCEEWEEISEVLSRQGRFFGLKVKGDSMSPRIQEGDILIVKSDPDAESGDVVIAKVNGEDACCKKLIKIPDGIILQSFNPSYEPMMFNMEDIENKPLKIIGKVVENRQKF